MSATLFTANHPSRLVAFALEVALGVAIALTTVFMVLQPVLGVGGLGVLGGSVFGAPPSVEATLDVRAVTVATTPELPTLVGREIQPGDGLEATIPTGTTIAVQAPDTAQRVGLVGSELLAGLLAVAVLVLLLRMVRTLRARDPFVPANARRLYVIAALVGLGGQGAVLLRAWGEKQVLETPRWAPYLLDDVSVTLVPLVVGLGVAVAAEVFRQGAALRADVEGLV